MGHASRLYALVEKCVLGELQDTHILPGPLRRHCVLSGQGSTAPFPAGTRMAASGLFPVYWCLWLWCLVWIGCVAPVLLLHRGGGEVPGAGVLGGHLGHLGGTCGTWGALGTLGGWGGGYHLGSAV